MEQIINDCIQIFEKLANEVYIFRIDSLKFVYANKSALKNLGYSLEEIQDLTPLDIKPELTKEQFINLINPLLNGKKKKVNFETVHQRKDKSIYYVEVHLELLDYRKEKFFIAFLFDITKRKSAEKALCKSEMRYRSITEYANDSIIVFDNNGNILEWNHAAEKMFGYSEKEILNKPLDIIIPPKYLEKYKEGSISLINAFRLTGKTVELEGLHKDGEIFPIDLSLSKWSCCGEEKYTAIIRDITQRKMLEEKLIDRERWIHLMMESIPNPAWIVSNDRIIIGQNKAAETFFGSKVGGYCWEEIHHGKYLIDGQKKEFEKSHIPKPHYKCFFCLGDEVLEKGEQIDREIELSGTFWDTWWIPLGKGVFLYYAVDITKHKKAQKELLQLSITDTLTKCYNRRYFVDKIKKEIELVKRYKRKFSILMFDIDHFKKINDTYGHDVGDKVLIAISDIVRKRIRKIDILCRWGGEEFLILSPETPLNNAHKLAEELRKLISNSQIDNRFSITVSFGVTEYKDSDDVDSIIKRADNLMYKSKIAGRNLVTSF